MAHCRVTASYNFGSSASSRTTRTLDWRCHFEASDATDEPSGLLVVYVVRYEISSCEPSSSKSAINTATKEIENELNSKLPWYFSENRHD